jgi:plastocyanin
MLRRLTFSSPFAWLLVTVIGLLAHGTHARAANDLSLLAGDGEGGYAVNAFLPATVTVREGSSLRWEFPWYEPHTISFGTPVAVPVLSTPSPATYDGTGFVTSDVTFGPGKSYTIQFTRAGAYSYFCFIHPSQFGTVVVTDPTAGAADTQTAADARATGEYRAALAELKGIADDLRAQPVQTRPLPGGATEFVVKIARETKFGDAQQYFPPQLTVDEGDTVTWRSAAHTPHTVTLGPFPAGVPLPGNPAVDGVFLPAESYEGSGYWNSGVLGLDWTLGPEFSLRFTKPGTYAYYCIMHLTQGMIGTVEVVQRAPPSPTPRPVPTPLPPATGTGFRTQIDAVHHETPRLLTLALVACGLFAVFRMARR